MPTGNWDCMKEGKAKGELVVISELVMESELLLGDYVCNVFYTNDGYIYN